MIIENALNQNRMLKPAQAANSASSTCCWTPPTSSPSRCAGRPGCIGRLHPGRAASESTAAPAWDAGGGRRPGRSPTPSCTARRRRPYRALELIELARTADFATGTAAEDEALADLIMSEELRSGLYAFDLVHKRAKRPAGAPDKSLARPVTKVGVVGAGLMASQLALLFARRLEVPVVLTDLDQDRLDKGVGYVHGEIDQLLAKGRISADKANRLKALVTGSLTKDAFADADFVIEAVFEELAIKQAVFAELEQHVGAEAILATNTSSLSITEMAADLHASRAGGRLPLLQPGRGAAAARDRPRRSAPTTPPWPPRSPWPGR